MQGTFLNLIVASVKETAARCRVLETQETITLRASRLWDVVPGETVTVSLATLGIEGKPGRLGERETVRMPTDEPRRAGQEERSLYHGELAEPEH